MIIKILDEGFYKIILDFFFFIFDFYGLNNFWDLMGLIFRLEVVEFLVFNVYEKVYKSNVYWGLFYGWNVNDGFMFGVVFYNIVFLYCFFEYLVVFMFGL